MPFRVDWDSAFATGDALVDAQHQALLAQCNRLADCCGPVPDDAAFDAAFDELKRMAREHFAADPEADDEEFDWLVDEIATTAHFDRLELQRFVAGWWLGHVRGSAG